MRIDSSGQVGIGTSSPASRVELSGVKDTSELRLSSTTNDSSWSANQYFGKLSFYSADSSGAGAGIKGSIVSAVTGGSSGATVHMAFSVASTATNEVEAMRIDDDGNLLIGKTTTAFGTAGIALRPVDGVSFTRSSGSALDLNRLSTDGEIIGLYKDGTSVGSIGTVDADLTIYTTTSGHAGLRLGSGYVAPTNNAGTITDNAVDLGISTHRFQDLYLSGGVYLGGTTSANLLDDYEEGAFVSSLTPGTSGSITLNSSFDELAYTKIGRLVTITGRLTVASVASPVGTIINVALPFTAFGAAAQSCGGAVWKNTETAAIPIDVTGGSSTAIIRFDPSTLSTNQYFNFSFSYTAA